MDVRTSASDLLALLSPHGPAYRPGWLNGSGVDTREGKEKIVLYVEPRTEAIFALMKIDHRRLYQDMSGLFWWDGFPVEIVKCGPPVML